MPPPPIAILYRREPITCVRRPATNARGKRRVASTSQRAHQVGRSFQRIAESHSCLVVPNQTPQRGDDDPCPQLKWAASARHGYHEICTLPIELTVRLLSGPVQTIHNPRGLLSWGLGTRRLHQKKRNQLFFRNYEVFRILLKD